MNRDEITAGEYILLAEVWEEPKPVGELARDPFDQNRLIPESTRHVKGDRVQLDVEEARRLYLSGAVAWPAELEAQKREVADALLAQAEQAADALLPSSVAHKAEAAAL